jgi:Uma2 family endonuclease
MATVAAKLSVAEFEKQYGDEKPYYEYWHGEAVQKSQPTGLHGLLQRILLILLTQAGYEPLSEVKLKIDPDFQPVPDVIATNGAIELPYPTRPLEIIIEILSEDDRISRVLAKCRTYEAWGFEQVYIVDPERRVVLRWHDHRLEEVNTLAGISTDRIWSEVDRSLSRKAQ